MNPTVCDRARFQFFPDAHIAWWFWEPRRRAGPGSIRTTPSTTTTYWHFDAVLDYEVQHGP